MLLTAVLAAALAPAAALAAEGDETVVASAPPPGASAISPAPATQPEGAAPAAPSAPTATLKAAEGEKPKKPFNVGVSLGHSVGSGTFYFGPESYEQLVTGSLNVSPSYGFELGGVKLSASAGAGMSFEYTIPDNSLGRPYGWSDLSLGLSAPGLYKHEPTGISVSANVGTFIPTTLENWWGNVATGINGGISLAKSFGKLNLGGRFGASKTFYTSYERRLDANRAGFRTEESHLMYICRVDANSCLLKGGSPTLWAMSGGLSAGYSPIDRLSFSIGFTLGKSYAAYIYEDTEFTTRIVDSNGNPVGKVQGQRDSMNGSIGASYKLTDSIGMSLGMSTAQAPLTPDNKAIQFPFFSFNGWRANRTSFSLGFSASY